MSGSVEPKFEVTCGNAKLAIHKLSSASTFILYLCLKYCEFKFKLGNLCKVDIIIRGVGASLVFSLNNWPSCSNTSEHFKSIIFSRNIRNLTQPNKVGI